MRRYSRASTATMTRHAGDSAERNRTRRADPVAGASDRHQSSQKSVGGVTGVPLLQFHVAVEDGSETGRAGSQGGVCGDAADADEVHRRKCAAGIEPVPAEPQNQTAADGDRQIVRQHGLAAIALELASQPRPQNDGASQRDHSADGVDHRRAGKVMEAHAQRGEEVAVAAHQGQPAIRSPGPVSDDRVNETRHADAVKKIADESGAADHCARSDGRAGIGKGELEDPDCQEGHAGGFVGVLARVAGRTSDSR